MSPSIGLITKSSTTDLELRAYARYTISGTSSTGIQGPYGKPVLPIQLSV